MLNHRQRGCCTQRDPCIPLIYPGVRQSVYSEKGVILERGKPLQRTTEMSNCLTTDFRFEEVLRLEDTQTLEHCFTQRAMGMENTERVCYYEIGPERPSQCCSGVWITWATEGVMRQTDGGRADESVKI